MFNNIGEKIKSLAIFITIIGMVCSIVVGIVCIVKGILLAGLIIIFGGGVLSWVGTFIIYGFGELICKTTEIAENTKKQSALAVAEAVEKSDLPQNNDSRVAMKTLKQQIIAQSVNEGLEKIDEENIPLPDECPNCFAKIKPEDKECPNCGYELKK